MARFCRFAVTFSAALIAGAGALMAAPAPSPQPGGGQQAGGRPVAAPWQAAVEVRLVVRGDAERVEVRPTDVLMAVMVRQLSAPRARRLDVDHLSWRKRDGDRSPVALDATLRWVRRGPSPGLELLIKGGRVDAELRAAGGRVLARASHDPAAATGPDEATLALTVAPAVLDGLPPVPHVRHPRLALAFYYPWYGRPDGPTGRWAHWNPAVPHHTSKDRPTLGWYDSRDPAVIRSHMRQARQAGLDGLVVSWWNMFDPPMALYRQLLDAAAQEGLVLVPYFEQAPQLPAFRRDLQALTASFANHAATLRVDGEMAVMFYVRAQDELGATGIQTATAGLGLWRCAVGLDPKHFDLFESLHTYFHAEHYERYVGGLDLLRLAAMMRGRVQIATVMPAYDDRNVRPPGFALPADGGARWRHDWALARGADWVLVTSFNEWHEGSQIESSVEHGDSRIHETRRQVEAWRSGP